MYLCTKNKLHVSVLPVHKQAFTQELESQSVHLHTYTKKVHMQAYTLTLYISEWDGDLTDSWSLKAQRDDVHQVTIILITVQYTVLQWPIYLLDALQMAQQFVNMSVFKRQKSKENRVAPIYHRI